MPGKKKGGSLSLADALTATRSARSRVLALAARLEETERTILAAMSSSPRAGSATQPKRPVGRPRTSPAKASAPARGTRGTAARPSAPARRPVGRPRG